MIQIQNLHKSFAKNPVLEGLDLEISKSGIIAVLGPNGSGKTTLIKCLLGMVIPDKGNIIINDTVIKNKWEYRDDIAYLPQIANFPTNLKVRELFKMIKDIRNSPTKDGELIELFKLQPFLNKKLGTLSGGTTQKVNVALNLMYDTPLIILDEPTTGLDPVALLKLKSIIKKEKEKGKTILITSHIMSFVEEMADEIIFLLEGKIYFKGTTDSLLIKTNAQTFEKAIANLLSEEYV